MDIAPTITAETLESYQRQMSRIATFTKRIHVDVADGQFAPTKLLSLDQVWWPQGIRADIHMMVINPYDYVDALVKLRPDLVIVHAESEGSFATLAEILHSHGIRVGVALLPKTKPHLILPFLDQIDHVLIFAGKLGYQGGKADLSQVKKIAALVKHKSKLEIGWDGGVHSDNARKLFDAGVDVLNVGGYIAKAINPYAAYATLEIIADSYKKRGK